MTSTLTPLRSIAARRRPPADAQRLPLALRLLLGVASGLALWASFPPLNAWYLAPVGVALLWVAVSGARAWVAATAGLLAGLAQFVALLTWLRVVGVDAWLVLSLTQAAYLAALGAGLSVVRRLPGWALWGAALWVAEEMVRSRAPLGGFSWGRLAFGQSGSPLAPYAAVGGAPLVTFAVALAGGLLAWLLVRALAVRRRTAGAAVAALAAVATAGLAVPLGTAGQPTAGHPGELRVAVVQGNVPRLGLDEFSQARAVVHNHANVTEQLAREVAAGTRKAPDIVVWPENASDFDPMRDAEAHDAVSSAVRAVGVPTLVGAVLDGPGPDHVRNAGIVWDPQRGPLETYVKQHLVPFGEYVPFRAELGGLIGRLALVPRDFVAGTRPGVLQIGPTTIADVICFEVADDGVVREAVDGGGRLLVVQTNNATYEHRGDDGYGGESAQQLAITRLRAVEHGRAAVVAATSGVSAIVGPDGSVMARTGVFEPAVIDRSVPLRSSRTLADRVGAWPEIVLSALGVAALIVAIGRRRWGARP